MLYYIMHHYISPMTLYFPALGDVGLRAVSSMAAAVLFDAVARQRPEDVASVLAEALGQRLGLGGGAFANETAEQAEGRWRR